VEAEPDNPSLLDSLAWVLYKRGRFEEARRALEQALGLEGHGPDAPGPQLDSANADKADPVVLDHMGDVLYRLNDRDAAARFWERSHKRLGAPDLANSSREDLKPLRLQLQNKQRQLKAGDPVTVAPVVEAVPRQETRSPATRAGAAGGGQ
jgi:tetratricopeptide (TPR) repeat protein